MFSLFRQSLHMGVFNQEELCKTKIKPLKTEQMFDEKASNWSELH